MQYEPDIKLNEKAVTAAWKRLRNRLNKFSHSSNQALQETAESVVRAYLSNTRQTDDYSDEIDHAALKEKLEAEGISQDSADYKIVDGPAWPDDKRSRSTETALHPCDGCGEGVPTNTQEDGRDLCGECAVYAEEETIKEENGQ